MPTIRELLKDGDQDKLAAAVLDRHAAGVMGVDMGSPEGDRTVYAIPRGRAAGKATAMLQERILKIIGAAEYAEKSHLINGTIKGFNVPAIKVGAYTLRQSRAHCRAKTASIQILRANYGNWDLIKSFRYTRGKVESKLEALGKARNRAMKLTKSGDRWAHLGDPDKNWQIDYDRENGNYQHHCLKCKSSFMGHKHRLICRKCDPNG